MAKNTDGSLGPICNHCGGFGFTDMIGGGSAGCPHCLGSGVDEKEVLRDRLAQIEAQVRELQQVFHV